MEYMRKRNLSNGILTSLFLLLGTVAIAQQPPQDTASLTDTQIVELANKAYANCSSYRDSGVVVTTFVSEGRQWTAEIPFTTAFSRPDRLRLEFKDKSLGDPPPTTIIWSAGGDARTWRDIDPGVKTPADLGEALAAATGVSQGISYRVPSLLMPGAAWGGPPLDLHYSVRIGDMEDAGFGCFRIRGQRIKTPVTLGEGEKTAVLRENSMTIWIDKHTYLVRKVEESNVYDTFSTEATTSYNPEINVEIPSEALEFGAPQSD
jgi:outer membrane lipoprotein-sorting protein